MDVDVDDKGYNSANKATIWSTDREHEENQFVFVFHSVERCEIILHETRVDCLEVCLEQFWCIDGLQLRFDLAYTRQSI